VRKGPKMLGLSGPFYTRVSIGGRGMRRRGPYSRMMVGRMGGRLEKATLQLKNMSCSFQFAVLPR